MNVIRALIAYVLLVVIVMPLATVAGLVERLVDWICPFPLLPEEDEERA